MAEISPKNPWAKAKTWLCLACQRGKHQKCWGRWVDHLDNQPWVCPNATEIL